MIFCRPERHVIKCDELSVSFGVLLLCDNENTVLTRHDINQLQNCKFPTWLSLNTACFKAMDTWLCLLWNKTQSFRIRCTSFDHRTSCETKLQQKLLMPQKRCEGYKRMQFQRFQ